MQECASPDVLAQLLAQVLAENTVNKYLRKCLGLQVLAKVISRKLLNVTSQN